MAPRQPVNAPNVSRNQEAAVENLKATGAASIYLTPKL